MANRLEVVVTTLEEAIAAQQGGAHSVEVVAGFAVGGLTPPLELVQQIRAGLQIEINVIVRPHARSFNYDANDVQHILSCAGSFAALGINGIVACGLTPDNALDIALLRRIRDAAPHARLTIHRAIDLTRAPLTDLQRAVGIATRVLASGSAPSAWEGQSTLQRWIEEYASSFEFVCAGGITAAQIPELASAVNADVIHVGSAARVDGKVNTDAVRRLRALIE